MTAEPQFEIFIPPSPTPSPALPQQDDEPPLLPEQSYDFVPQFPAMIYDQRRGPNAIFPRFFWPWFNRHPHYQHHVNPYTHFQPHPPQPLLSPSMQINPQLSINFRYPDNPYLVWDMIHPPQLYARIHDRTFYFRRLVKPRLQEYAVLPNVKKAWILSDHPVLGYWVDRWGPMVIKSDNVLVEDILNGIYEYLRTPLTQDDLSQIGSLPRNRQALRYARAQRAKDSHEIESVVIAHGYRRIDVVGGHRRFQGLQFSYLADRTWRLRLSLLPGTLPKIY